MNCTAIALLKISNEIRHVTYKEKMSLNDRADTLLEKVNELKELLTKKTATINGIVSKLEKLTWLSGLNQECLEIIYNILFASKDLHHTLTAFYVKHDKLRSKGIAKNEFMALKSAFQDLKEINEDIETVFFKLPQDQEYQEIIQELQTL